MYKWLKTWYILIKKDEISVKESLKLIRIIVFFIFFGQNYHLLSGFGVKIEQITDFTDKWQILGKSGFFVIFSKFLGGGTGKPKS